MTADPNSERAFLAMEAMLSHLHPKEDPSAIVATLRDRFVSADAMLRADQRMLESIGLRANDALLLSRLSELTRYLERSSFEKRPRLASLSEASPYLVALFHGLQVERFYLLCLDARGRLKEQVMMQEGTSDGALFSLRRMLAEAIHSNADALIISHNHPGLTLRPSPDDVACTRDAIRALTALGIPLLDHVIIAGRQAVSLRDNGFVPAPRWLRQKPGHRLLENWLNEPAKREAAPKRAEPKGASAKKAGSGKSAAKGTKETK